MQIIYWISHSRSLPHISRIGKQDDLLDKFITSATSSCRCFWSLAATTLLSFTLASGTSLQDQPGEFSSLIPLHFMAFACSSSAATLPLTRVHVRSVAGPRWAFSLRTAIRTYTVNMSGTTIYFTTCLHLVRILFSFAKVSVGNTGTKICPITHTFSHSITGWPRVRGRN
jgi:hypothetical protein